MAASFVAGNSCVRLLWQRARNGFEPSRYWWKKHSSWEPQPLEARQISRSLSMWSMPWLDEQPWFEEGEPNDRPPRAVVLVLGWGGAQPRPLRKYAALYQELGCATVAGIATKADVFVYREANLDAFALEAVARLAQQLRRADEVHPARNNPVPVVVHSISNGGVFVTSRLGKLLDELKDNGNDEEGTFRGDGAAADDSDLALVGKRLAVGCQVFDSAPCYPSAATGFAVIRQGLFWGRPVLGSLAGAGFAARTVWKSREGQAFWNDLLEDSHCPRQAFVYTTDRDDIAPHDKIADFVAQREAKGVSVRTRVLNPSQHVQHLRLYPAEYKAFLMDVLDDLEEEAEPTN